MKQVIDGLNESLLERLLDQLTMEEKVSLCSGKDFWRLEGIERLGIPSIMVADGPHGLRKQGESSDHLGLQSSVKATCFPTAVSLAASWDRQLLSEVGKAIAEECLEEDVAVLLGPGVNIKRSPLCGRNFEYYSEDPFLAGELAAAFINGVQSQGVGTSLKHFAANNQESYRMVIDTFVDERALREIYLAGFERAVKVAQPWTVMSAYNKVNGTYASESRCLLTKILRQEWGFQGIVVSDWGATNDRVEGLKAGLDLEMPSSFGDSEKLLLEAVRSGELAGQVIDEAVKRLLRLILKAKGNRQEGYEYDRKAHHQLARKAAGESMVLLKNEGGVLPLKEGDEIAIIGEFARKPRYQGSGSSLVNPLQLDNAYDGFISRYGGEKIRYARGYDVRAEESDQSLIDEAVALARQVDQVILFAGLTETYESEGFDRQHLNLPPAHNRLIEEVSNANDKAIVVLANGAPVTMPWLDKVKAVLEAYLAGQAGGSAVWDVLSGDINPSGKLAETFPLTNSDCPAAEYFPMGPTGVEYRESIYVGYRYYDTAGQVVLFPFGHGLSYTDFAYSDLNLSKKEVRDDETLEVRVRVRNTGDRFGKEVVQLYIRDKESSVFRPNKELKGFIKVALQPGEEKEAGFVLDRRSFAYYDTRLKAWHVESGDFEILIGASAADIRLTETVHVESTVKVLDKADNSKVGEAEQQGHVEPAARIDGANKGKPMDGKLAVYYNVNVDWQITREQFAQLYGREIVHPPLRRKGEYDINTTIGEIRSTFLGRQLYKIVMREVGKAEEMDEKTRAMYAAMVKELPLRNLIMGSGGWISREILEAIIMMLNGRYLKGAGRLYKIISGKSSAAGKTR